MDALTPGLIFPHHLRSDIIQFVVEDLEEIGSRFD